MHQLAPGTISEKAAEAVALLRAFIATPSFSREEAAAADVVVEYLAARGVSVSRVGNNVWARNRFFDANKKSILLNSHLDTVKPNKDYTRDPFSPDISGGALYGLGANDAGGCLVCLLQTFLALNERQNMKYNILFAATAEEEISGANGIEALLPHLGEIAFGIVGEPTEMEMAVAEKGLLVVDFMAEGASGHAAREEGVNAIYKAMADIEWLKTFSFPKVSSLLGPVKVSVTMINAGTQHNVVPAICNFTADIRLNDLYTHQEVLDIIGAHVSSTVSARSLRLKATSIPEDHELVKAGDSLGLKPFGSATMSDKALMPFPALKIGPGSSSRSHMADEFIYLSDIEKGIDLYLKLLNKIL